MARVSEQPETGICPKREYNTWVRGHRWIYGGFWNGCDTSVLGSEITEALFAAGKNSIARSGWRCYHCGNMEWDQSDAEFKAMTALSLGFICYPTGVVHGAVRVAV